MAGLVGYKGNSGESGNSGVIAGMRDAMPHDTSLVEIVSEKRSRSSRRDINLVCPFAGKSFCFDKWKASFKRLPINRSHVLIYDNGNDPRFSARLRRVCAGLDSYTLVRDSNQQLTTELSFDFDAIGARCRSIYGEIYNRLIDTRLPYCLNLEDDITIPAMSFERLATTLAQDDVVTVIGQCNCRRAVQTVNVVQSIAVDFRVQRTIGRNPTLDIGLVNIPAKDFGVDAIGAGHMGLWLTETAAIKTVGGMGQKFGTLRGNDINWGYAVNDADLRFAIDWSVKLGHHYEHDGVTLSC